MRAVKTLEIVVIMISRNGKFIAEESLNHEIHISLPLKPQLLVVESSQINLAFQMELGKPHVLQLDCVLQNPLRTLKNRSAIYNSNVFENS